MPTLLRISLEHPTTRTWPDGNLWNVVPLSATELNSSLAR